MSPSKSSNRHFERRRKSAIAGEHLPSVEELLRGMAFFSNSVTDDAAEYASRLSGFIRRKSLSGYEPLLAALDKDRNSELSTEEIDAAPESLAKLDKNNDDELTPPEIHPRPPRPPKAEDGEENEQGPPPQGDGQGRRPGPGGGDRPPRGR